MGSATTAARAAIRAALTDSEFDAATADELFFSARVLGSSGALRGAVTDSSVAVDARQRVVRAVFGGKVSAQTEKVLQTIAAQRWSRPDDILIALEELGIRVAAATADADARIEDELFAVQKTVESDAELELALRSKLADPAAKAALVDRLLSGKASAPTVGIVRQLVQQPLGRSIREALREAIRIVADEADQSVAVVTSAARLSQPQIDRLRAALSAKYGRKVAVNLVIDPALLGGLRVQIGDDVIDSSVASRLNDLKLKLAG